MSKPKPIFKPVTEPEILESGLTGRVDPEAVAAWYDFFQFYPGAGRYWSAADDPIAPEPLPGFCMCLTAICATAVRGDELAKRDFSNKPNITGIIDEVFEIIASTSLWSNGSGSSFYLVGLIAGWDAFDVSRNDAYFRFYNDPSEFKKSNEERRKLWYKLGVEDGTASRKAVEQSGKRIYKLREMSPVVS